MSCKYNQNKYEKVMSMLDKIGFWLKDLTGGRVRWHLSSKEITEFISNYLTFVFLCT